MQYRALRTVIHILALLAVTAALSKANAQEPLPRRGSLGVALGANESGAVILVSVLSGSAAAQAGLAAGDVIAAVNGVPMLAPSDLQTAVAGRRGGDPLEIEVVQAGEARRVVVVLQAYPVEQVPNARMEYGHVALDDGVRLRTIVSTPLEGPPRSPAVLLLQGGGCGSVDMPWPTNTGPSRLMHALGSRGFVTMRVEKSGVGDSEGPPCGEIGYLEELAGYRAALRALRAHAAVDPARVFLIGVSLGGFFAPVLANAIPVAGISVYGTIGFSPMPYPGRSELFFQEIAEVDILAEWRSVAVPVQALQGEFDEMTTRAARADHALIARLVNEQRPGSAEHRELAGLDHCWTRHATLEASVGNCGAGEPTSQLGDALLEFLLSHM